MPKTLRDAYAEVAPHGENLQSMFDKAVKRMRNFNVIPVDTMRDNCIHTRRVRSLGCHAS